MRARSSRVQVTCQQLLLKVDCRGPIIFHFNFATRSLAATPEKLPPVRALMKLVEQGLIGRSRSSTSFKWQHVQVVLFLIQFVKLCILFEPIRVGQYFSPSRAMAQFDAIAATVLDEFEKLPANRKPAIRSNGVREWVPLSGIVAERTYQIIEACGLHCMESELRGVLVTGADLFFCS